MLVPKLYSRLPLSNLTHFSQRIAVYYSTTISNGHDEAKEIGEKLPIEEDKGEECHIIENDLKNDISEMQEFDPTTRGKKLRPTKANIVVLDHKQSGLLGKRDIPDFFKRRNDDGKLSILEGVELGSDHDLSRYTGSKSLINRWRPSMSTSSEILREIESQRKKLLVFKSRVSKEQALRSINYQKPPTPVLSKKRYEQLKLLLDTAYTATQLQAYIKKYFNLSHNKATKTQVINRIMDECWKCAINDSINESEDLILERIIDVNMRDMYLLLLTNNGKILNNFARIGATVAVALDESIVIVRGTAPIIRYVEVSLNKILANVDTIKLPIRELILNHTERDSVASFNTEELISLVQRESAVHFEKASIDNEESGETYVLSAFGSKRLLKAKNLLLWGVQYQPQLVEKVCFYSQEDPSSFRKFPFTNIECLNWIDKTIDWYRLQKPLPKTPLELPNSENPKLCLDDRQLDEWYDFLKNENERARIMDLKFKNEPSKIFSMTLGQILTPFGEDGTGRKRTFQPKISQVTSKLLELPLYESPSTKDEIFNIDQHEYYVQLKFIPDLSTIDKNSQNVPPIELWFELDDYDNALTGTTRCLVQLEQKSLLLQTPQLQHDYKINSDTVAELTDAFDENQENWLNDQPGIKEFLQESQLSFNSKKKLVIPKSMNVELPKLGSQGKPFPTSVQYDYVNAHYHRVLRLLYMNKYMVQFSDVKCGQLGGRYTQVDFVGEEILTRDHFKQFVKDILINF